MDWSQYHHGYKTNRLSSDMGFGAGFRAGAFTHGADAVGLPDILFERAAAANATYDMAAASAAERADGKPPADQKAGSGAGTVGVSAG